MKALLLTAPRKLEVTDLPIPAPAPNQLLVRIKSCGICGSDVHGYDGSTGRRIPPLIMGHEAAGIVESVGNAVTNFKPGDRITFDSTIYCNNCPFCKTGRVNLCDNRRVLGVSCGDYRQHGCFAEFVCIPNYIAYKLPDSLSFDHAAMIEAVSIAIHAASRVPTLENKSVVIVGAGMIGQLLTQTARAYNAKQIITIDIDPTRLAAAKEFGATLTLLANATDLQQQILDHTAGGADIAFEAVGSELPIKTAITSTKKGAHIILVGNISASTPFPLQQIVTRELTLHGTCASAGEYPTCLSLMSEGKKNKINVAPLISLTAPLEEGPKLFDRLYNKEPGLMKVILNP